MTDVFDGVVGPGIQLPVPTEVIALLRMPISITPLAEIVPRLDAAYGQGLVIRTDLAIEGWLVIALPQSQGSGS